MTTGIVLFAHGAREKDWARPLHPKVPVRIAPPIGEVDTILAAITGWIEELHR